MDDDHNPLDSLPSLPSNLDAGGAALWAGTVLMTAALERGWTRDHIVDGLLTLAVVSMADFYSDEEFHARLQAHLDSIRARRAPKQ